MKHVNWSNKGDCCGCGACKYACPADAIAYILDEEGFSYPQVDETRCINCGKCLAICPQVKDLAKETLPVTERYGAKYKDAAVRSESRSGGAFTAVSNVVLKLGGCVYGAVQTAPERVEHLRAETPQDRDRMRGSKYVQSDMTGVYAQMEEDLRSGRAVLFSGTPCQCAAVYNVFPTAENLYLCDFLCHGVPSQKLWGDYLNWTAKKYRAKVLAAEFRDKREHPWESHVESVSLENKTVYSRRYANLFCQNAALRPSCYACRYTRPDRVSDFTLADYWGIDEVKPEFNDGKGISLLMLRTEKAQKLFEDATQELELFDAMPYEPKHYNLKRPTACPENRESFWHDYESHGFAYVSAKYGGYDVLRRIKNKLVEHVD